jgi:Flp pilus assembly protein TadG
MARQVRAQTRRGDRGSFSLELAVLAPALLLVISFIISVGRVTEGRAFVQGAARDAARAATINHNGNAEAAARAAYAAATRNRDCDPLVIVPRVPLPGGTVTATAHCRVSTLWGKQTIVRTSMSAVDIYRGTD